MLLHFVCSIVLYIAIHIQARHIRLASGIVDTTIEPSFTQSFSTDAHQYLHTKHGFLIHFDKPINNDMKREVEDYIGVKLTSYIPDNTYLVYISNDKALFLPHAISDDVWIGTLPLKAKIGSKARSSFKSFVSAHGLSKKDKISPSFVALKINLFDGAALDVSELSHLINQALPLHYQSLELNVISHSNTLYVSFEVFKGSPLLLEDSIVHKYFDDMLDFLSNIPEIKFIETTYNHEHHNKYARWVTQANTATVGTTTPFYDAGIDGTGQIVGVGDWGLDVSSCWFSDVSNPIGSSHRKVVALRTEDEVGILGDCGHGTHVCGSILGNDRTLSSLADYNGMASNAKLTFYSLPNSSMPWPSVYTDILTPAYQDGARIHSNSWGCATEWYDFADDCNQYDSETREFDSFVYDHPDLLVLIATGNDADKQLNGAISSPAGCKNCISVGATMNVLGSYSSISATLDERPELQHDVLTEFSNAGPTFDGRIKPEVVSVGDQLRSAYCDKSSSETCHVSSMSGTSMATPVVAGNAALVRQYFTDEKFIGTESSIQSIISSTKQPKASLLKAALINSAQPMRGRHVKYYGGNLQFPALLSSVSSLGTVEESGITFTRIGLNSPFDGTVEQYEYKYFRVESSSYKTCSDYQGWLDTDGDGCSAWEANNWCPTYFLFSNSGVSVNDACCFCGGGYPTESMRILLQTTLGDSDLAYSFSPVGFDAYVLDDSESSTVLDTILVGHSRQYTYVKVYGYRASSFTLNIVTSDKTNQPVYEADCDTLISDVMHQGFHVRCPKSCVKGPVIGEVYYNIDSRICASARHQGAIETSKFGSPFQYLVFTVSLGHRISSIVGYTRNQVNALNQGTILDSDMFATFLVSALNESTQLDTTGFDTNIYEPTPLSGFGYIAINEALPLSSNFDLIVLSHEDLALNNYDSISYFIKTTPASDSHYLRFTLVWTDPPAELVSEIMLVNDLDLTVTTFNCDNVNNNDVEYLPNALNQPDRLNVVEQITISGAKDNCIFHARVFGHNIPVGDQKFSLLVTGLGIDVNTTSKYDGDSSGSISRPYYSLFILAIFTCLCVIL